MIDFTPRRSILYMPGINARALEKAKTLPVDTVLIDLEDAVAPQEKANARELVKAAMMAGGYGYRARAIRINALASPWGREDLQAVKSMPVDAIAIPKVETAEEICEVAALLEQQGNIAIWAMIETPRGVLNVEKIAAAHPRLSALVMGTSDLANDLQVPHTVDRIGLLYGLSRCVMAARANNLTVIDGVHLDLQDDKGFMQACEQGRNMGFDGKSLIHPKQITTANRIFSPSKGAVEHAQQVIEAWKEAEKNNTGVVVVNGKLVENLHVVEAKRILAVMNAIQARGTN